MGAVIGVPGGLICCDQVLSRPHRTALKFLAIAPLCLRILCFFLHAFYGNFPQNPTRPERRSAGDAVAWLHGGG